MGSTNILEVPEIVTEGLLPNGEPEIYRLKGFEIHPDVMNRVRSSRKCTLTLHSADPKTGFMPVLVKPLYTRKRLNRHPSEYLGRPVDFIDSRLSLPVKVGIEQALSLGSFASTYEFEWDETPGEIWRFVQTFDLQSQHGLVARETLDDEEEFNFWQSFYWLRRIKQEMAKAT